MIHENDNVYAGITHCCMYDDPIYNHMNSQQILILMMYIFDMLVHLYL